MQPIQWTSAPLEVANINRDGTGTVAQCFKAKEPCYIRKVYFIPLGDNAVCVGRVFANNGGDNAVPQNNSLLAEATLAAVAGSSQTAAITPVTVTFDPPAMLDKDQRLLLSVSVDLTGSAGYSAYAVPVNPADLV